LEPTDPKEKLGPISLRWSTVEGDDPIPVGAIGFSDAFQIVVTKVELDPFPERKLDEPWVWIFQRKRSLFEEVEDCEESYVEQISEQTEPNFETPERLGDLDIAIPSRIAILFHQQQIANVLLRQSIQNGDLLPCVRDPATGETLQLARHGWLPLEWTTGQIPSEVTDFASDTHFSPGSSQSFLRDAYRRVFFQLREFESWIDKCFAAPEQVLIPVATERPGKRRLVSTKNAILEIWGPDFDRASEGMSHKSRFAKVDRWLKDHGRDPVSDSTFGRALSELRQKRD
jgi:hypothetical protein